MQIQLCEDDSLFHGGVPQLVVLVVKFDDGKTKRIPYEACKTIAALYQDLYAIAPQVANALQSDLHVQSIEEVPKIAIAFSSPTVVNKKAITASVDKSNIIEKEDIVTMVKLHARDTTYNGTMSPLMVGMDYRVIKVIGPTIPTHDGKGVRKIIEGFEVIDDHAPTPERMIVYPDEVVLKSKRLSEIVEVIHKIEEILPCPHCSTKNSLALEGSDFKGVCHGLGKETGCGVEISIARIITKCLTPSCKKENIEVSCFDVGGKYEGTCGKCSSRLEVPYA